MAMGTFTPTNADAMNLSGDKYYESIDLDGASHPQTILAYEMNGQALPIAYGAPLRLRDERQLGYKMAKYIMRIELVEDFTGSAAGTAVIGKTKDTNGGPEFDRLSSPAHGVGGAAQHHPATSMG